MKRYLEINYTSQDKGIWFLELDIEEQEAVREVECDENYNIIRKAPTKEDNYGCFTDNLNIVIAPQNPHHKETTVFNLNDSHVNEISKEEFEKIWSKPFTIRPKETMNLIKFFRRFFS